MKLRIKIPEETKTLWRSLWHNRWLRYSVYALGITIPLSIYAAALISIPHTFVGGQLVRAGEVNTNFKTIYDALGITEAKGLTVGANIEAQGFTLNGTPVGSSSDSFWSVAGSPNISYNGGNVGIGITPAAKLHVNGDTIMSGSTSDNSAAALNVKNSGGTSMLYVGNDGNVGIGTTNPAAKFQINAGTAVPGLRLEGSGAAIKLQMKNTSGPANQSTFALNVSSINNDLIIQSQTDTYTNIKNIITFQYDGLVGIGTLSPTVALHVVGGICTTIASGTITACASDARLKKNIRPITNALPTLMKLNPVTYQWNKKAVKPFGYKNGAHGMGLIAQEVEKVNPLWVGMANKKYKKVKDGFLSWYMLKAMQELKIEKDQEITALEAKNAQLEARLDRIERMMARAN